MTYLELQNAIRPEIFTIGDVAKYFPHDSEIDIRVQLHRFMQRGLIKQIKRGLYCLADAKLDEFKIANLLYSPSYISLETALNYHGVIPDITVGGITCVTTVTTKDFSGEFGRYFYHKIDKKLFWGFVIAPFNMATAEKALWDYTYLYGKNKAKGLRIDWSKIDRKLFKKYDQYYR